MFIFIILVSSLIVEGGKKCYGINFEGGGTHGTYEAGAMMAITEFMPAELIEYDIITGISIGAINTCTCAEFPKGEERAMAQHMLSFWNGITGQDMMCPPWRGGTLYSLFFRPSLYNNQGEGEYIAKYTGKPARNVSVAATNVNTGEYTNFDETLGDKLATACFASGAAPFLFPSVQVGDQWFMDGGVTSNIDVYRAVERCRNWGFDDSDIVMDVIFCTALKALPHVRVNSTREAMNRIQDTIRVHNLMWFADQTFRDFPYVDFRLVQYPTEHMPPNKPGLALDFDPADIQFGINLGYNDSKRLIQQNNLGRGSLPKDLKTITPHYL